MNSRAYNFAIERLTISCVKDRGLHKLWDGTDNKQSNEFILLVQQLATKLEPETLPDGIDATICAVIEYWLST